MSTTEEEIVARTGQLIAKAAAAAAAATEGNADEARLASVEAALAAALDDLKAIDADELSAQELHRLAGSEPTPADLVDGVLESLPRDGEG